MILWDQTDQNCDSWQLKQSMCDAARWFRTSQLDIAWSSGAHGDLLRLYVWNKTQIWKTMGCLSFLLFEHIILSAYTQTCKSDHEEVRVLLPPALSCCFCLLGWNWQILGCKRICQYSVIWSPLCIRCSIYRQSVWPKSSVSKPNLYIIVSARKGPYCLVPCTPFALSFACHIVF